MEHLDTSKITTTSAPTNTIGVGDTVKLQPETAGSDPIWADVKAVDTDSATQYDTLTLSKKIPENGTLVTVVRGFRTKFTDAETLAIKNKVEFFCLISSDKAVNPMSIMGMTKRYCEKILLNCNNTKTSKFFSVRFGNVMESKGITDGY